MYRANPVLVNKLFLNCLNKNLLKFQKINKIEQEVKLYDSRIDFILTDNKNIRHVVECKYAPTVDYHPDHKPIKNVSVGNLKNYKRAAIFPDGWQYKKGAVVSEQAIKHLNSLIKCQNKKTKSYLIFFALEMM